MTDTGFECKRCHYTTEFKSNLLRHLRSKRKCQNVFSDISTEDLLNDLIPKRTTVCSWCKKEFSTTSNLRRHETICRSKSDTSSSLNELVQKVKEIQHELDELKNKQNTITNNITSNTQNINISVTPQAFLSENMEYFSDDYFINCAKRLDNGLIDFIKQLRFNPDHPENMNVKFHRLKQKTLYVYKNGRWEICDAKWTLEEMIVHGARILYQKMLSNSDQEKFLDEDSTESKIQTWLLSLLPRTNEKAMGILTRRIYAMILDNQVLLIEQNNDNNVEANLSIAPPP
jgi:hypothetical protein